MSNGEKLLSGIEDAFGLRKVHQNVEDEKNPVRIFIVFSIWV